MIDLRLIRIIVTDDEKLLVDNMIVLLSNDIFKFIHLLRHEEYGKRKIV